MVFLVPDLRVLLQTGKKYGILFDLLTDLLYQCQKAHWYVNYSFKPQ